MKKLLLLSFSFLLLSSLSVFADIEDVDNQDKHVLAEGKEITTVDEKEYKIINEALLVILEEDF